MTAALFRQVEFDQATYDRVMQKPAAQTRYVIYFTPRSGSSWLTDVLAQTKRMSRANEAFNPNFIPNIARVCNASTLDQYVNVLTRRHNNRGVYGFEITMHQLKAVFPSEERFLAYFGTGPCFWLIRRDIVSQAVSLAKMVTTKVAHTAQGTAEDWRRADESFSYSPSLIRRWLKHILVAERETEAMFAAHGMTPLRMCYEEMMPLGPERVAQLMMRHVGVEAALPEGTFETKHNKLGTARNEEYADRFRRDEADFLKEVEAERVPWLARFDDLAALAAAAG